MTRPLRAAAFGAVALLATSAAADEAVDTIRWIQQIHAALARHQQEVGQLPEDGPSFGVVVRVYARDVPFAGEHPVDGWQRPFAYRPDTSARGYALYSFGSDGIDDAGTGDDLVSRQQADTARYPGLLATQRRALGFFPLLLLCAMAPVVYALLRWAKRHSR